MISKNMREIVEHRSNSIGYLSTTLTASGFIIYDLARHEGASIPMLSVVISGILASFISRFVLKRKYKC